MDVEFHRELDGGHRAENVYLVLALEGLVGREHDVVIEVELEVVTTRVVLVDQA